MAKIVFQSLRIIRRTYETDKTEDIRPLTKEEAKILLDSLDWFIGGDDFQDNIAHICKHLKADEEKETYEITWETSIEENPHPKIGLPSIFP